MEGVCEGLLLLMISLYFLLELAPMVLAEVSLFLLRISLLRLSVGLKVYCVVTCYCISRIFFSRPSLSTLTRFSILSRSRTSHLERVLISGLKVASSSSLSSSSCL